MFERFTDRARRVVALAQEEARMLNHNYIGTEHILLGLIHEGEGVGAKALESLGIALEGVRQQVEEIVGQGQHRHSGHIPFTPRAKRVLELSLREALQLSHNYIGTEHILLGLIREGKGVAAQVLVKVGIDLGRARQQVLQLLAGGQQTPAGGQPSTWEGELSPVHRDKAAAIGSGRHAIATTTSTAETTSETVVGLETAVAELRAQKEAAIGEQDFELAARLRDEEKRVLHDIESRNTELGSARHARATITKVAATEETEAAVPRVEPRSISPESDEAAVVMKKVFISYRREETSHIAGRMADWLTSHLDGFEIFVDVDSIDLGVDFRDVIAAEVGKCDVLLAVMGRTWATAVNAAGTRRLDLPNDLVRIEVESALTRSIRVIPILVDDAVMPAESELPAELAALARRNALTIRHGSFRQDVLRLIAAVKKV
jgi:Clp amino terminal domain, pathogenicity island component/TIR domain/UvrB/uvrC motif